MDEDPLTEEDEYAEVVERKTEDIDEETSYDQVNFLGITPCFRSLKEQH